MFHTSTWLLVLSISLIAIIKTIIASPPSFVVNWFVSKIDTLHPQLSVDGVTISLNGMHFESEDKLQVVNYFNHAVFLKKYDVLPTKPDGTPIVIDSVRGKKHLQFFLYIKDDRVDVFKYNKKKAVAFYLSAENAPELFDKSRELVGI